MSIATDLLQTGTDALITYSGETVTYSSPRGSASVFGMLRIDEMFQRERPGVMGFFKIVESKLPAIPADGDEITAASGKRYRVVQIERGVTSVTLWLRFTRGA